MSFPPWPISVVRPDRALINFVRQIGFPAGRANHHECWEWIGFRHPNGYGMARYHGQLPRPYAHRLAYQLFVGPIPVGHELDHLCGNKGCVNPAHLEAVTHAENMKRAAQRGELPQSRAKVATALADLLHRTARHLSRQRTHAENRQVVAGRPDLIDIWHCNGCGTPVERCACGNPECIRPECTACWESEAS